MRERESKGAPERARENQAGKTRNGRGNEVRGWGERGEGTSGKREMYSRCVCAKVCT